MEFLARLFYYLLLISDKFVSSFISPRCYFIQRDRMYQVWK